MTSTVSLTPLDHTLPRVWRVEPPRPPWEAFIRFADLPHVVFLDSAANDPVRQPAAWKRSPPSSSMRLAQFQVPAAPGSGPAAFIVYYFGPGQGGSASANIARWTGQFSAPGGGAATPEVSRRETSGMPVTVVRLQGDYARGVGTGPVGTARPDQVLRAAIIESSRGNVIVQLHGPAATVDAAAADFDRFVAGIR